MSELKFVSRELKITFNEKVYMIRYPSVGDIRDYNKKLSAKNAIELHVVAGMLETLGLPTKIVDQMEVPFIEAIVEELTARKK
tara:strand:- start:565 stop:813 length:249 start_codon:yes stop_codon:yes gene_type:complete